jgi:choline dehydrogenase-like flavoprotein
MLRLTPEQLPGPQSEWPITYKELDPYYSEVEKLLELGGAQSKTAQVPDGDYLHLRSLNAIEGQFRASVMRRWPLRHMVVNHVAQYEPAPFSPMLRLAIETGRLKLSPGKVVAMLAADGDNRYITGVTAVCTATGAQETYRARSIVLAASAFETIRILLNSQSKAFPHGVGNQNGLLGTRILEHIMVNFFSELPRSQQIKASSYGHNPFKLNAEPHGFFIPPFSHREGTAVGYHRDYGVQGTMSDRTGLVYIGAFGETVPQETNRLTLDARRKDQFGIPLASIDFTWDTEDLTLRRHAAGALAEMINAFCNDTKIALRHPFIRKLYQALVTDDSLIPGSNHECGGARMGNDPSSSVVDPFNRLWDAPNVLVCDSACFPLIPYQNPTLTTMALALRASRHLAAESPKGSA